MFRMNELPSPASCLLRLGRFSMICNASRMRSSKSLLALPRTLNESKNEVDSLHFIQSQICVYIGLPDFVCSVTRCLRYLLVFPM